MWGKSNRADGVYKAGIFRNHSGSDMYPLPGRIRQYSTSLEQSVRELDMAACSAGLLRETFRRISGGFFRGLENRNRRFGHRHSTGHFREYADSFLCGDFLHEPSHGLDTLAAGSFSSGTVGFCIWAGGINALSRQFNTSAGKFMSWSIPASAGLYRLFYRRAASVE